MNNNKKSHKWIIVAFVLVLLSIATVGIVKSRQTREFVEEKVSPKTLDSLVAIQIDKYLMSYDFYYMYDNLVVVDSTNQIIGNLILYTNKDEVKKYWESDSTKIKT